MSERSSGGTSRLLRELRSLRVIMLHPDDSDGQELRAQLQRIGFKVKAFWPPPERSREEADIVFLALRPEVMGRDFGWLQRPGAPPVVAVVQYEDPTTIEALLRLDVAAVLPSPVKSFGLLTKIVIALHLAEGKRERERYVERLERRLAAQRKLNKAKTILMETRRISEDEAYRVIRDQAMAKRVTTEEIADAVIKANEILGIEPKPSG
jgi:AmiR/NasT family two-component response regulator